MDPCSEQVVLECFEIVFLLEGCSAKHTQEHVSATDRLTYDDLPICAPLPSRYESGASTLVVVYSVHSGGLVHLMQARRFCFLVLFEGSELQFHFME